MLMFENYQYIYIYIDKTYQINTENKVENLWCRRNAYGNKNSYISKNK